MSLDYDKLFWSREMSRCATDFAYLTAKYLRIKSKAVIGFPTLQFNNVQRYLWAKIQDQWQREGYVRQVWGKSRQVGASTLVHALNFWRTNFHDFHNSFIIAHDEPSAYEQFDKLKTFYDALPAPLKSMTRYSSKSKMDFEDRRSRVLVGHARNVNVGAGEMNHFLHMTEAARYPNAEQIQTSIFPSISDAKGKDPSFIIIESTSFFGGDWFKDFAEAAQRGENGFEFHFIPWFMHTDYQAPVPRDFAATPDERHLMATYGLSPANVVWRRRKRSEYSSNLVLFDQEYPLCLIGETKVSTQRGIIDLCDARVGDCTESGVIAAVIPQGEAPIFTAETACGYRVTGTAIHRLQRIDTTFVHLGESVGALLALRPPRFAETPTTVTWQELPTTTSTLTLTKEWGRFLGYFVGDGSFHVQKGAHGEQPAGTLSVACTSRDGDVIKDVQRLFVDLFGLSPEVRPASRGGTEVRATRQGLIRPLMECGVVMRQGPEHRRKRHVCVPPPIWRSPRAVIREFLRGLYEADGHIWKTACVMLASKYRDFLQDVQLLLLGFGITSKLTQWSRTHGQGWVLVCRVAESKQFMAEIGFISEWKNQRGDIIKSHQGRRATPLRFEDTVVSVTPQGLAPVYDLTLPAPHTFSANGIAVHNSWSQSWILPSGTMHTFETTLLNQYSEALRPGIRHYATPRGLEESIGGPLEVWVPPVTGCFYDIGIDIAEGRTQAADWTVVEVIRRDTLEQVAEARGHWDPAGEEFLDLCYWTGMAYNRAQMIPDITGGWGHALMNDLQKRDYPNLWQWRRRDDAKERVSSRVGFLYTKRDKALLVNNAVRVLQRERPLLHSPLLVDELRHFLTIGLDEWGASPGYYDDTANAWMLALMGSIDEGRHGAPVVPLEVKPHHEKCYSHDDMEDDLSDGHPESGDFARRYAKSENPR